MKNLAVLHSGDLDNISPGGIDQYVKNLITGLDNYHITLFGVSPVGVYELRKPISRQYNGRNYTFVPIIDDSVYPLTPRFIIALARSMKMLKNFDCIFAQRSEQSLPFIVNPNRRKLIQIVHGSSASAITHMNPVRGALHLLGERMSVSIARRTIIISKRQDTGIPYYLKRYKAHRSKILYGHIPVDLSDFYPRDKCTARTNLKLPLDKIIIAYCGRVEQMPKRVLLYPDIAKKLGSNYHFLIIGGGADLQGFKDRCLSLGIDEMFTYTGYLQDRSELALYLASSDMSINISSEEGTCTSILESLACGIPVVSTDTGDVNELVKQGLNGIVIRNAVESDELITSAVEAISYLTNNPPRIDESYKMYEKDNALHELAEMMDGIK